MPRSAEKYVRSRERLSWWPSWPAGLLGAGLPGLGCVLPVFGVGEEALALVRPMTAFAPGLIPMVWLDVLHHLSVGMRRPGPLLAVSAGTIVVNAALDLR